MSTNDLREALATYKDLMVLSPRDPSDREEPRGNLDQARQLQRRGALPCEIRRTRARPMLAAQRDLGNLLYDRKGFPRRGRGLPRRAQGRPGHQRVFQKIRRTGHFAQGGRPGGRRRAFGRGQGPTRPTKRFSRPSATFIRSRAFSRRRSKCTSGRSSSTRRTSSRFPRWRPCQAKSGKIAEAILSYEQATALKPGNSEEQKALGDLYMQQGKKAPGDYRLSKVSRQSAGTIRGRPVSWAIMNSTRKITRTRSRTSAR